MLLDHMLSGRMERRLPIIVVVRLAQAEPTCSEREERTFTDNITARGARVFSTRLWQVGDAVQLTPRNEAPACGNVVYCQRLADDHYAVGVKFQDSPITWSAVRRYDGLQISPPTKSDSS
jgi:hypothetical protein